MGVYINMEMPKDCLKCPFCLFANGYWKCLVDGSHADFGGTCRPSLCPLVPVPEHGDLIDRDALKAAICSRLCIEIENEKYLSPEEATIVNEIFAAPTIIPTEEGE